MQCLLLAGCAIPNFLAGIYIFSFALGATDTTEGRGPRLEIRVGHFYLCARSENTMSWSCGAPGRVREDLLGVAEPWNLDKTAYDLRSRAISPSLK
jgi:hypothetical protein